MRLILLDVDEAGLKVTAELVGGPSERVRTGGVDVADRARIEHVTRELLGEDGSLDLLINCAAILGGGAWTEQLAEDFDRVVAVDLLGTVNMVRATSPALTRAGGHVVIIASTAAAHGWPGLAAYSAAKFGLVGYSEGVRAELANAGIGLTVVFPLLIDTPLLGRSGIPPILRKGRRIPAARVVKKTLHAVARRRPRVYVPATVRLIVALHGLAPGLLDWHGKRVGFEPRD
jgi:NAD(P)-dependent dehydrogenase (short-subunit alcohol dehydrogenase family)